MYSRVIKVTQANISHAVPRDSHMCMIADAVQEQIPSARYISVDVQSIRYTNLQHGKRYIFLTPPIAADALVRFDQGKKVRPFKLTLRIEVEISPERARDAQELLRMADRVENKA